MDPRVALLSLLALPDRRQLQTGCRAELRDGDSGDWSDDLP